MSVLPSWSNFSNLTEIEAIDTHAPLLLRSSEYLSTQLKSGEFVMLMWVVDNKLLCLDLLAIHMVREAGNATIISYHHDIEGSTSAEDLFTRLKLVGRSVYWSVLNTISLRVGLLFNEQGFF